MDRSFGTFLSEQETLSAMYDMFYRPALKGLVLGEVAEWSKAASC